MIKKQAGNLLLRLLRRGYSEKEYAEIRSFNLEENLRGLLLHAFHNVPYYNEIFRKLGIVVDNVVDLSKFGEIPILTKEIMRTHHQELISKDFKTRKWYYNSSGGSTGEPIRFIQDELYEKWINMTLKYYYQDMLGIDQLWAKKAILWGSERDLFQGSMGLKANFFNWLSNTVFLNSFRMTEKDIAEYVATINSFKPNLIRGYAGSLYDLCLYSMSRNLTIHKPKILVSSAEALSDEMRQKIEAVFGTKLYDFYGSREAATIAGECKYGLRHIFMFNNYVEILDNYNQPVEEGGEGKVIITNLHNYSMPLIRYEIGDMAILGPKECSCGNLLPTLKKITGRITDHFIKEDGTIISGAALTLTFNLKDWVKAFQIIQEDYKRVTILIVPQGDVDNDEKHEIEDKIKFLLGQDCQVVWEFIDEIPKTQSGKYLYIKSLIQR